jgi:hypothetical protein
MIYFRSFGINPSYWSEGFPLRVYIESETFIMRKMNFTLSAGPVVETPDVKRVGYSDPEMDCGQTFSRD